MKISYRWLGRHVDLGGLTPQQVAEDLTLSTCEVESLERFLPHLANLVVGFVKAREKHPDADKLSRCTVDVGDGTLRTIVCGAPNVDAGQKVAVALPGTELPGGIKIKKSKIRGVESEGMICSERELGLGEEHSGIWVLPADAPLGKPLDAALGLDDWVIEIDNKSLTHRPDLWGHRGFAREIAAMHGLVLRPLASALPTPLAGAAVPVHIDSPHCSRYLAVPIDGVSARRSPDWLRALLFAVEQRPIDLLVDLSNFVMLDLGQPNHVFDRSRLSPEGIAVRNARAGETIRTLDGVERALVPADLLICSGDAPVALAGVMGGEGSKVESGTQSLLLEVASFHFASVRRTAQRLALRTDSSTRFEKQLDPTLPLAAAAHYLALLREIEPLARVAAPWTDAGQWTDPALTLRLRPERARSLLGVAISDERMAQILGGLGFGVQPAEGALEVRVPSARATKDVTIEQDLIEEIGRIHRYGNIPERQMVGEIAPPPRDAAWDRRVLARALADRLAGSAHFHELLSYSFVSDELVALVGALEERFVCVVNPVADGLSKIRRHVLPSVLEKLLANRRQSAELRFFEIGKGYQPEYASTRGEPREVHELALVWAGVPREGVRFDGTRLAELRGLLDELVAALGFEALEWRSAAPELVPSWAHPGMCLSGRCGAQEDALVTLAPLEPGLVRRLGLSAELQSEVAAAELSIDVLLATPKRTSHYRPLPKFPLVKVDVAAAAPAELPSGTLAAALERAGKGLVDALELFDVYTGANLGRASARSPGTSRCARTRAL
ncbi:MAG: phenylalanine--tRNA ligase subunit beta [Planctomycetes bacterium]|nr:phenylalanine--tRNA ligase subunit beta [Planctomycetota bacterium]